MGKALTLTREGATCRAGGASGAIRPHQLMVQWVAYLGEEGRPLPASYYSGTSFWSASAQHCSAASNRGLISFS